MSQLRSVKKVLITNIVSLNVGDAAILFGTIEILREKYGADTDIVVFDRRAEAAKKHYPWATFRQALFPAIKGGRVYSMLEKYGYSHWVDKIRYFRFYVSLVLIKCKLPVFSRLLLTGNELSGLEEYISSDLILSTGGTYLIENYNLYPAILDYRISILAGKKFGFFTQTLGPFVSDKNKRAFRGIFSKSDIILLRDERSKNHIIDLGVSDKNIFLASDAAFILARYFQDANSSRSSNTVKPNSYEVAVSVRSMKNFHPEKESLYFEAIADSVCIVVREFGAKVTFLSTCQGIDEYWTKDDEIADKVYSLLPSDIRGNVLIDRKFRQPLELAKKYKKFDAVIATRMHAAILSLCAGVPTLGVAYEFKMVELYKKMEMGELVIDLDSFMLSDMSNNVRMLLSENDLYRERVKSSVKNMYTKAWIAKDALPFL